MSDLTPETLAELKRLGSQLPQTTLSLPGCQRPDWDGKGELGGLVEIHRSGFVPTTTTIRLTCAEANYLKSLFNAAPAMIAAEECERLREQVRELEHSLRQAGNLFQAMERNQKTLARGIGPG